MSGLCKLYMVTGNKHKLEEANGIVKKYGIVLEQAPITEKTEIQSERLEKIALHAARIAYNLVRAPLVVDDSGLFVEALKGFPGPYSSYVYKKIGYRGILKLLDGIENRRACFKTVVALILPPIEKTFIGITCGSITSEPRGSRGFGFDPIFVPEGCSKTYAEMDIDVKNKVSHRYKAFSKLGEWITANKIKCQIDY